MLKDYKSLELDKILQQLANETTCADAAALAAEIEPDTDLKTWSAFCRRRTTPSR